MAKKENDFKRLEKEHERLLCAYEDLEEEHTEMIERLNKYIEEARSMRPLAEENKILKVKNEQLKNDWKELLLTIDKELMGYRFKQAI